MPKVALYNVQGSQVGEVELKDEIFGIEPNESVVHEAVVMQMASRRQYWCLPPFWQISIITR